MISKDILFEKNDHYKDSGLTVGSVAGIATGIAAFLSPGGRKVLDQIARVKGVPSTVVVMVLWITIFGGFGAAVGSLVGSGIDKLKARQIAKEVKALADKEGITKNDLKKIEESVGYRPGIIVFEKKTDYATTGMVVGGSLGAAKQLAGLLTTKGKGQLVGMASHHGIGNTLLVTATAIAMWSGLGASIGWLVGKGIDTATAKEAVTKAKKVVEKEGITKSDLEKSKNKRGKLL